MVMMRLRLFTLHTEGHNFCRPSKSDSFIVFHMHCDCFIKFQDLIFVDDKLLTKVVETTSLENLYVYTIQRTDWYYPITLNKQPGILINFNARFKVIYCRGPKGINRGNMVYTCDLIQENCPFWHLILMIKHYQYIAIILLIPSLPVNNRYPSIGHLVHGAYSLRSRE